MVQGIDLSLLKKLSLAFGPSGCESDVAEIIYENVKDLCDKLYYDKLHNLIAVKYGSGKRGKKLMISAHMDEVGFMITNIDDDGCIRFGNIGGIDPRVLCGRKVTLGDENKKITGIISSKPIHLQEGSEAKEATLVDKMYIDIGAKDKADAEKYVNKGDFGIFDSDFVEYGHDMLKAKALDDRLGCTIMCDILRRFKDENITLDYDVYFAFTVREEVGLSGAIPAAYGIAPDYGIVLESTAIADLADVPEQSRVADTGNGGVISLADNGTIYDRDFIRFALDTGKKYDVKCQVKRYVSGGNDASGIQKSRSGVKMLAISAPCRYLHSASNVININDYKAIRELLYYILMEDITK